MKINANQIYHIYNQGNNCEPIFHLDKDYIEFLQLFRKYVYPHCKVLAYCLMPNHYHFLVYATEDSALIKRIGNIDSCQLSNGFRLLQSSYAQAFNKRVNRTGSLFRQKTKAKSILDEGEYQLTAFWYIHQNSLDAGLVEQMADWPYSSFRDFAGLRNGTLCDIALAQHLIGFDKEEFAAQTYQNINSAFLQKIFDKRDRPQVGTAGQTGRCT